jgi:hypothetical protein
MVLHGRAVLLQSVVFDFLLGPWTAEDRKSSLNKPSNSIKTNYFSKISLFCSSNAVLCTLSSVRCQCTFGATFASTSWHDNTKGTLTFTSTGMTGWSFKSIRTVGTSTISSWQCVNHTDDTYLILRYILLKKSIICNLQYIY